MASRQIIESRFPGFPPEALRFLRSLKRNNRREWFQPRKDQFETVVKAPMLALVAELNRDLVKFAPEYVTDPKKAVFRIYRDTRFSADKTPYKTNIAASFSRRGLQGGGLYFSVSHESVEVAAGIYHPTREVMLAVRTHIAENHKELLRLLEDRKTQKICGGLRGDELSRAPKGINPDHPAIDLIKKKDWIYDVTLEAAVAETPALHTEIVTRFRAMWPLVEFLNRPLIGRKAPIQSEGCW